MKRGGVPSLEITTDGKKRKDLVSLSQIYLHGAMGPQSLTQK